MAGLYIEALEIVGVTDTTPKQFRVHVTDGLGCESELSVKASTLNSQKLFNTACIEDGGRCYAPMRPEDWSYMVDSALRRYGAKQAQSVETRRRLIRPVG